MHKTRIQSLVLSVLLLVGTIFTPPVQQTARAQKVGTTSMQFLKVLPTARAIGMGTAYTASALGVDAVYWNPAGIAAIDGHHLNVSYVDWLLDISHNSISYGASLGRFGNVGVHVYSNNMGAIEETRVEELGFIDSPEGRKYNPGLTGNTFQPSSWVAGLTYARHLTNKFAAGLSLKYAVEDLYLAKTEVPLFDFGMTFNTAYRSLRVGASVMNFGPPITFVEESFPTPMTFRIGLTGNVFGGQSLLDFGSKNNELQMEVDLVHPRDYDQQWAVGAEYKLLETLFARAGYRFNHDSQSYSLGVGLHQNLGGVQFKFDYAFSALESPLSKAQRFSLQLAL